MFLSWFYNEYAGKPSVEMYSDFCLIGCWRFVLEDPDCIEFPEVFDRFTAAKELNISPFENFDNAPALLLDLLLVISLEMQAAIAEKAKRENK